MCALLYLLWSGVWVSELRACVSGEHVDNDYLAPLLHLHQQYAQLAIVAVDQVNALRAHLQQQKTFVSRQNTKIRLVVQLSTCS